MPNYPVPPGRRIAYDRDDCQVVRWQDNLSGITELSAANIQDINDEADDTLGIISGTIFPGVSIYLAFLLPQAVKLLDLKLSYTRTVSGGTTTPVTVEYSDDTTNGRDGTWATAASGIVADVNQPARPDYRTDIAAIGAAATHLAYRLKFAVTGGSSLLTLAVRLVHMYGPEHGPTDRLAFWHPTLDQELTPDFDFEDIARGASVIKQFRIKNVSALTANGVDVTVSQGPSYGSASSWTLLSLDDITYAQTRTVGDLGVGVISNVLYLRAEPPVGAELDVLTMRVTPVAVGGYT